MYVPWEPYVEKGTIFSDRRKTLRYMPKGYHKSSTVSSGKLQKSVKNKGSAADVLASTQEKGSGEVVNSGEERFIEA